MVQYLRKDDFEQRYREHRNNDDDGWGGADNYRRRMARFDWFVEETGITRESRILEIGCGAGNVLRLLYEQGYHKLAGLDIAEEAIRWAEGNLRGTGIDLLQRDLTAPACLPAESYDVVFDTDCIQMITRLPRAPMWRNIHGALQSGGHFLTGNNCMPDSADPLLERDGKIVLFYPSDAAFLREVTANGFTLIAKRVLAKRYPPAVSWNEYIFRKS